MSRDPNRIRHIVATLEAAWQQNPDLRLGQLVHVAATSGQDRDPFYVEDADTLEGLRRLSAPGDTT